MPDKPYQSGSQPPTTDEVISLFSDEEASIRRADAMMSEAREADEREARRKEDRIGWTPKAAKMYEPGHPWADIASYPSANTLQLSDQPEWNTPIEAWGFPLSPKFAERRLLTFHAAQTEMQFRLERYDAVLTRGAAELPPHEINRCDGNEFEIAHSVRVTLSLLYTQIVGMKRRLVTMRKILIENGEL